MMCRSMKIAQLREVVRNRTGTFLVCACWLVTAVSSWADIIPSNRRIDWTQAGVPGGIPKRTTIYTTISGIDNTGATDVSAAIQSVLDACPPGQVVYLPAGTYLLNNGLSITRGITLRGATNAVLWNNSAGPGVTIQTGMRDTTFISTKPTIISSSSTTAWAVSELISHRRVTVCGA